MHAEWDNIPSLIESALASYRMKRWADQNNYVEVWVEKDALSGVLEPVTDEFHVLLMVNRGYSSQSAMHEAALRFLRAEDSGKKCTIIYLGDHDPSGNDMVRDIGHRLNDIFGCNVTVKKIALTMEQIEEYNPPPNPVKMTDSRANDYVDEHGEHSWELDALSPDVLDALLRETLNQYLDSRKYRAMLRREEEDKDRLRDLADEEFSDNEE